MEDSPAILRPHFCLHPDRRVVHAVLACDSATEQRVDHLWHDLGDRGAWDRDQDLEVRRVLQTWFVLLHWNGVGHCVCHEGLDQVLVDAWVVLDHNWRARVHDRDVLLFEGRAGSVLSRDMAFVRASGKLLPLHLCVLLRVRPMTGFHGLESTSIGHRNL